MKAIMTGTGGRAPPGQNRRSPSQDLVGLPEFAVLPLQRLDPLALVRSRPGPHALVAFSLAYPVPERLARAADLGRDRADRRMLRAVLALVFQHHPHRAFADLRRKGWGSLRHGSILARSGASGKPRAVQSWDPPSRSMPVNGAGAGSGTVIGTTAQSL